MRVQLTWLFVALWVKTGYVTAQSKTVFLPEANVYAPSLLRYAAGVKVETIDSTLLTQYKHHTLDELLANASGLALKNYGVGRLSSVSLRGTGPTHTAVLWNGININLPTLGQSDFSTIPLMGFDKATLQLGASGSLAGSGAVGGSIYLESMYPSSLETSVAGSIDGFRNTNIQAKRNYAIRGIRLKSGLYYEHLPNEFWQWERKFVPVGHSTVMRVGLIQEAYYATKKNIVWSLHTWWGLNDLNIEPRFEAARQYSLNGRTLLKYQNSHVSASLAWLRDRLDYYASTLALSTPPSASLANRYISKVEYDLSPKNKRLGLFRLGAELSLWQAYVDGYKSEKVGEWRGDVYGFWRKNFQEKCTTTLTARQSMVAGFDPPFTPAWGLDYTIINQDSSFLSVGANVSRSFRVPTLNERYWKPQGNTDLRPENGWQGEFNILFRLNKIFETKINVYQNTVNNWAYWNPDRNYRVENLHTVRVRGLEWRMKYERAKWQFTAQYAYTQSLQTQAYGAYNQGITGKQLPYIPLHTAVLGLHWRRKKEGVSIQTPVVGYRFIDFDNQQVLPTYLLINIQIFKQLSLFSKQSVIQLSLQNLTNTFYLNAERKAMPGIGGSLRWTLSF